jgi:peptidylamidoglycolate lyase
MQTFTRVVSRSFAFLLVGTLTACGAIPPDREGTAPPGPQYSPEGYERGGEDMSGPYEVVPNWPQPIGLPGLTFGRTASVYAESPDRVFVLQSAMLPVRTPSNPPPLIYYLPWRSAVTAEGQVSTHIVTTYDRNGKLKEAWTQWDDLFRLPHRIRTNPYDPERPIWVVDNSANSVFKFSNDGSELLMRIGELQEGDDETHFHGPNDIAFLPNGDFFVVESHHRLTKWSAAGTLLLEKKMIGLEPGRFGNLHSVDVDARQRVYVADWGRAAGETQQQGMQAGLDRGRLQIFDADLNYLDEWPHMLRVGSVRISTDQRFLYGTDDTYNKLLQYDLATGRLLSSWGTYGARPGNLVGPHDLSVDTEGNLYVPEIYGGRVQKFRPRDGAPAARIVGRLYKEHLE